MPNVDNGSGHYEIAPYTNRLGLAADIISSSILAFAVFSALVVIVALLQLDNRNKLRSRTLLGLFMAHIWSGGIFFGFIVVSLAGHPPIAGSPACRASAFLVESAIWCQYLFTIAVAVVSYIILLHPLAAITTKLERYWYLVHLTIYSISLGLAGLQTGLYQAVYIGGFCFNGSVGNLFNELIGCVPRAIVFFVIIALYWKIIWFLRRHRLSSITLARVQRMKTKCPAGRDSLAIPPAPQVTDLTSTKGASPWDTLNIPGLGEALMLSRAEEEALEYRLPLFWFEACPSEKRPNLNGSLGILFPRQADIPSTQDIQYAGSTASRTLAEKSSVDDNLSETSTVHSVTSSSRPLKGPSNPYDAGPDHGRRPDINLKALRKQACRENYETLHALLMRKAALLFMLFPLTYAILTIISLARLIDDYATPHPSPVMRAISRWTLFLQGPLDALTYGVIAFKIKKEVGKEIRHRWFKGEENAFGAT